jgi:hypothetical protein
MRSQGILTRVNNLEETPFDVSGLVPGLERFFTYFE